MKGVVLAGGLGTRLDPVTRVVNKHLLPVANKPMIYYPIQTLASSGIEDILIITGGNSAGDFLRLLGNGQEFGLKQISYAYQKGAGGTADALRLAEGFVHKEKMLVILGDNIIDYNIKEFVEKFRRQSKGARILLKEVKDPERFGLAELQNGKIIFIEEKPKQPKSNYAVTGIYMMDSYAFEVIKTLKPSERGQLEILDIISVYMKRGDLEFDFLPGNWIDAGTFNSLMKANLLLMDMEERKRLVDELKQDEGTRG